MQMEKGRKNYCKENMLGKAVAVQVEVWVT